jgi:hypothetical protein
MRRAPVLRLLASLAFLASLISLHGCAGRVADPTTAEVSSALSLETVPAPPPISPEGAVRFLVWCWEQRRDSRYGEVLTADFQFRFEPVDSAGNSYRGLPLTREDELLIARHLFSTGTPVLPPARSIEVHFSPLTALPDPRPGKTAEFHRVIRVMYDLMVVTPRTFYHPGGSMTFFLVRGDSAQVPDDLRARGWTPDPSRWWIERWDEGTVPPPPGPRMGADAPRQLQWSEVKLLYR